MRTPFGEYPEYHTSADNLEFVSVGQLEDSFRKCATALEILDSNRVYVSLNPKCEPQLGKRGLYGTIGGQNQTRSHQMALLWLLNLSDGRHSLLDIAERSGADFDALRDGADALVQANLLEEVSNA
jgi:aminopeptidase-like protein